MTGINLDVTARKQAEQRALPYALSAQSSFEVGDRDFRCVIRLPLDAAQGAEVREE